MQKPELFTRRARLTAATTLLAVLLAAVVAYAAGASPARHKPRGSSPAARSAAKLVYVNPSDARPVVTLKHGRDLSVIISDGAKCVVMRRGVRPVTASCVGAHTASGAGEGTISVNDECGSAGKNLMEVTGLAPEDASAVRLLMSDGTSHTGSITDGVFSFEGTNPGPQEPYPTGIEWVRGQESTPAEQWPVAGRQFCEPAE